MTHDTPPVMVAGRYEIERELGRGGMGRVYVAHDRKLGRLVALKLLKQGPGTAAIERFRREARAVSGLSHPNIVAVHDAGDEQGEPYLVQELLTGRTLRRVLSDTPLPQREAVELALQCARGLAAAHEKGIVHRDLKPDNLFLTEHGVLKILDFGLAKLMPAESGGGDPEPVGTQSESGDDVETAPFRTRSGQIIGTVGYMAPEQVRGDKVDLRADIFLFGLVLYELISGKRAFAGKGALELSVAIVTKEPEPLDAPPKLRALVGRCLRKDPAQRPSAVELVRELESLASGAARARSFASRITAAAGLTVFVAALAIIIRIIVRSQVGVPPGGMSIAVLPLNVQGNAAQSQSLREMVASLMGVSLQSEKVRPVNEQSILRALARDTGPVDDARAETLAHEFAADAFIIGTIREADGRLTIEISVKKPGEKRPLIEETASGSSAAPDRVVAELCAKISKKLLGKDSEGREQMLERLARMYSTSASAELAYLRGEAALRRDDWDGAATEFSAAVAEDPRFALAHYKLAVADSLRNSATATKSSMEALDQALANRDRLQPRDLELVQALQSYLAGRADDAERRYRKIVADFPDDLDAQLQLGETLFHFNPLRGRPVVEAQAPFDQMLKFDGANAAALDHEVDIAQVSGQARLIPTYAARYARLAEGETMDALPIRWADAWARNDTAAREALFSELERAASTHWYSVQHTVVRALWQSDDLADAMRLAEIAGESRRPDEQAEALDLQATIDLALGRPDAAREKLDVAARLDPKRKTVLYRRFWPSTLDFVPREQRLLRRDLEEVRRIPDGDWRTPYIAGAIAIRLGDRAAAAAAISELEEAVADGSGARDAARGLRARLAHSQRDDAAAMAALQEQELQIPFSKLQHYYRLGEPYLRIELNPFEGERLQHSFDFYDSHAAIWFAPIARLRARQLESVDREAARRQYERYLQLRQKPEPALAAEVADVQRRLQLLR